MQKTYLESSNFVLRHELDRLAPTSAITAELATPAQLAELAAVARKEIPGVNASLAMLNRFLRDDPGRGEVFGGLMTGTQLISILLVLAGGLIWWFKSGVPKQVPAQSSV